MSRVVEVMMLRHGESSWNAEDRYQGQQGTGLSELGRHQAKQAAEYLRGMFPPFDAVVASDLQRVTETLQPYAEGGCPTVRVDRRWREIDVGTWSGRTFADILAEEPDVVAAFARGEDVARGGGETFAQLRDRVWHAVRAATSGTRVLVVTHGGPIRTAAAEALGLPPGGQLSLDPPVNCSLTVLRLVVDGAITATSLTAYNVPTSAGTAQEQPS
ncbi:MAG TPA: histidine phosphatase family protein [Kribbella sp.]|uniref:histidine phosphatase family protein n=1 Tax=Kribbella sp. TaxID=1871183 RepID=UPI002D767F0E|nr:histidine phosphatase family protein [Kribbella sp.]HET6292672.1 histidine phosphatase family protein [Kribbella sp.]